MDSELSVVPLLPFLKRGIRAHWVEQRIREIEINRIDTVHVNIFACLLSVDNPGRGSAFFELLTSRIPRGMSYSQFIGDSKNPNEAS